MKSPDATSLGISVTFTNKSPTVTLASAVNAVVSLCSSSWVASTNVTTGTSGTRKEGTLSTTAAVAGAFTTGKASYETISSTDYSGYQQLTFWIHTDTAVAANSLSLKLCSDTTGDTAVDTFAIDFALLAARWHPIVIDKGSALGSAIQSVALYVDTDLGAGTVNLRLDDILTAKASSSADSLNLTSLIGKGTTNELWYPIRSINGTTVTLDESANTTTTTTPRGYSGTTESVTGYKRETIKLPPTTGNLNTINESGTAGSPITYSGGWNTTDMTTQTGETWIDGRTSSGEGWNISSKNFINTEKLSVVRADNGFTNSGTDNFFTSCNAVGCGTDGYTVTSAGHRVYVDAGTANSCTNNGYTQSTAKYPRFSNDCIFSSNAVLGASINSATISNFTVSGTVSSNNNGTQGMSIASPGVVNNLVASHNGSNGILFNNQSLILSANMVSAVGNSNRGMDITNIDTVHIYDYHSATNAATQSIAINSTNPFTLIIKDAYISEATKNGTLSGNPGKYQQVRYQALGGVTNSHYTETDIGVIQSETGADRHTASGIAWKLSPTDTTCDQYYPLTLPVAKVAVNASSLVTIKMWAKRTSTSLTGILRIAGGRVAGVDSDVTDSISAAANTYEELECTCTPTEAGILEIYFDCYGGTTLSAFCDDMSISQA